MSTITQTPPAALATEPAHVQAETLFDVTSYSVDKAALKFTGGPAIDLSDERYVELLRKLTPGRDHKLTVGVRVTGFAQKFGEDEDGAVDEVAGTKTVTVHTVYLPE